MVGMTESWRRVGPFLSPFSLKAVGAWDKGTYCYSHSTTVLQSFNGRLGCWNALPNTIVPSVPQGLSCEYIEFSTHSTFIIVVGCG